MPLWSLDCQVHLHLIRASSIHVILSSNIPLRVTDWFLLHFAILFSLFSKHNIFIPSCSAFYGPVYLSIYISINHPDPHLSISVFRSISISQSLLLHLPPKPGVYLPSLRSSCLNVIHFISRVLLDQTLMRVKAKRGERKRRSRRGRRRGGGGERYT